MQYSIHYVHYTVHYLLHTMCTVYVHQSWILRRFLFSLLGVVFFTVGGYTEAKSEGFRESYGRVKFLGGVCGKVKKY